jgi:GMP synthase-like glutamine amidotransferase
MAGMIISVLQHAAFEGPGEIGVWAGKHGHTMQVCHLYRGDALPALDAFDLLLVMGGEMNIYEYRVYPWLKPERELIQAALGAGKRVIGICLGAQLIADALGARVAQNPEYEIGWLPVAFGAEGQKLFPALPETATVLHWHGDAFDLPKGATRLASSVGCPEQGYAIPGKCLGLQFHLEVDPALVKLYVEGQGHWPKGPYAQSPEMILAEAGKYHETNRKFLHGLLDEFMR